MGNTMPDQEKKVFEDFRSYANVVEAWPIYDTIVICRQFYGSEATVPGWFTTFAAFAAHETHTFFKLRTRGSAGLQYTNLNSADAMDFAYICHSVGIAVWGPPSVDTYFQDADGAIPVLPDSLISHFFTSDLPRHIGVSLKVQQDVRAEGSAMQWSPGYGVVGAGTAYQSTNAVAPIHGDIPFQTQAVCQGVPLLSNRYPLPVPIGIPRTGTIEGMIHLSQYARDVLVSVAGPHDYLFNSSDGTPPFNFFPTRYAIQMSLIGERLVQQRAQYHR